MNSSPFLTQKASGRIVRLHEVQGAAGLEPVDLLRVERVVDLDVERRSPSRGLDLQGQGRPLGESVETLDGHPGEHRGGHDGDGDGGGACSFSRCLLTVM